MAEGTCSVEGCERPRFARGWCSAHYSRWQRHGEPGPALADQQCSIEGCSKAARSRGWCRMHHLRWRKYGDPLKFPACGREGCDLPVRANGLCKSHNYKEWLKANDRSAYNRQWAEQNREARREYMRAWWQANPDYADQWIADRPGYGAENARRRRVRLLNAPIVPFTAEALAAKLAYWGGRCWLCGDPWAEWDHIKPLAKGGPHMLANLRPICVPCNRQKSQRWPFPTARAS